MEHLENLFKPDMTWLNYGEWHIDHIVPLASAKSYSEIIELHALENLQPLWAEDNRRKGDLPFSNSPKTRESRVAAPGLVATAGCCAAARGSWPDDRKAAVMTDTIATLDREIARPRDELAGVERQPCAGQRTFRVVEKKLRAAEAHYRSHGFPEIPARSVEAQRTERLSIIGALVVASGPALLKAERQRLEARGVGMSAADKARRLAELRAQVLRLCARREIAVRKVKCGWILR